MSKGFSTHCEFDVVSVLVQFNRKMTKRNQSCDPLGRSMMKDEENQQIGRPWPFR
jgi:hypothetical protein